MPHWPFLDVACVTRVAVAHMVAESLLEESSGSIRVLTLFHKS